MSLSTAVSLWGKGLTKFVPFHIMVVTSKHLRTLPGGGSHRCSIIQVVRHAMRERCRAWTGASRALETLDWAVDCTAEERPAAACTPNPEGNLAAAEAQGAGAAELWDRGEQGFA